LDSEIVIALATVRTGQRPDLRSQSGFTLIELLAAMVILSVGILTVVTTMNAARALASRAEVRDAMVAEARGEIQRIEALSWSNIALAANPTKNSGAGTSDPTYYYSTASCNNSSNPPATSPCYQWDWNNTSSVEPLVVSASTSDTTSDPYLWSTAISTSNSTTRISGGVYRFITYANDPNCTASACGGTNSYKRITVAVTVCSPGTVSATCADDTALSPTVELSTLWVNPVGGSSSPLTQTQVTCSDGGSSVSCDH
jgi:prepilin-type N-terminal cleavage/methylation domain-containing protein